MDNSIKKPETGDKPAKEPTDPSRPIGNGNPPVSTETQFSCDRQPINTGRKKGIPNRETIFARYLTNTLSPRLLDIAKKASGEDLPANISMLEALIMRLSHKGLSGDVQAIKEVFDRIWGKAQQHIVSEDITPDVRDIDLSKLTDAELGEADRAMEVLENLRKKGDGEPEEGVPQE